MKPVALHPHRLWLAQGCEPLSIREGDPAAGSILRTHVRERRPMMNDPPEYFPADSATDDLSEFELQEIAEDVIRDLREEGLLRPTPVNPAEQDAQSDSPNPTPPNWPEPF